MRVFGKTLLYGLVLSLFLGVTPAIGEDDEALIREIIEATRPAGTPVEGERELSCEKSCEDEGEDPMACSEMCRVVASNDQQRTCF